MKTFGENLYLLRKENKLTQEEIAAALNVTRQTISNWETDNVKPTIDKVIALSEVYGVSLDTLIGKKRSETKKVSPIFKKYEGARGILYMKPVKSQPFFPYCTVKNIEIIEIDDISMEIRIHEKNIANQLIFIKDVLGFLKEGN
ncbi:helix-turn-helix domain-containing protein [Proteiniclasticum ruminis]|uniref:Transcriptional regulator, contains XRE-family HTH domain n=1 Tax=Proteiniclasticum ruminis TaxID=398199 RepID=A0A1I5F4Q7_9CLOT|nr:helix-turn-helix transcriptional regulator [Proteiniclasticum ruminis]SFO18281.1 Transcriptional regulator, contains XRE-family HTH domain [Proteiniclasticum ruminis]